ncbi:uncharacterized protein EDB91DRAFT_1222975 [Suillus paluster]|uniref:uncharacterized protein n=1 Tax=Suillus paluster TaxID=48578 RepID=UPI001B87ADF4|nr:uncharacterized protein EDB91DRAFT_1222975 [Suillus paluster]KAG1740172.1 hypothetical protein EDB91DRAFT_1222975 [Suillus paluster]
MPANSANPLTAKSDLQGLELAEHHFGPLLHPTRATQSAWTNYSINRLQTTQKYRTVVDSQEPEPEHDEYSDEAWLSGSVKSCVSQIEKEMDLKEGTLQKCITILCNETVLDDEDPRSLDSIVRIYSPTTPMYINVHFQYYLRSRFSLVQWFYALGYKIQRRPSATAADASLIKKELRRGMPPEVHTRNGWQTLCWGYYDDSDGSYGKDWRPVEVGKVELHEEGVLDAHEALLGDLEKPVETNPEAMLAYHRSLIRSIRLLLAAVGISYGVACVDDETDKRPRGLVLEGLHDKWVGRGIRNACGLRLPRDAEEAREGAYERRDAARGDDDDSEDDDEYRSGDDDYGF